MPSPKDINYIKIPDLVAGYVYHVHSRSFCVGVWNGVDGSIGIRSEWGYKQLYTEYHWDSLKFGGGTVKPQKFLGKAQKVLASYLSMNFASGKALRRALYKWERRFVETSKF